jgi:hypothetical protein
MQPVVANEHDLYFERGGPAYRLMQRLGLIRGEDPSIHRRIFAFLILTWVPLLVLSLVEGHAYGPTPRESFLIDFASYARFFLAVPLLVIAEVVVGPRLTGAGLQFLRADFVRPQDYPEFEKAIARVARWRESLAAELIILGAALIGAWTLTAETVYGGELGTWNTAATAGGFRFSLTGLWYRFVSVPFIQFFLLRWIWRLIIWGRFLFAISRLKLDLVPTHRDEAGGLGFLGTAHTSLGIFSLAIGAVLSAEAAFRILFESANLDSFKVTFIAHLVTTEVLILGPLMLFVPMLAQSRREWLRQYSLLLVRYNREFHEKWLGSTAPAEPLLGSADIQSLADLGNSFQFIRDMKLFPFGLRTAIQLGIVAALPALPLLPLAVPVMEILKVLSGAIF